MTKVKSTMIGAGIDNHLRGGEEFGTEQQIKHRQRTHHHDQRKRAVDGMGLQEQVQGTRYAESAEDEEEE